MSSATSPFSYYLKQVTIYLGIPILVAGVIGDILCVIVFTSLHTFRNKPCSFYLTCASFVNIGQLLTGFLTRILLTGYTLNLTTESLFFCKFRPWLVQACYLISLTCICLATIDIFLATSARPSWQQKSNLKLARRLVIITCIIWSLHGIPFATTSDIKNNSCAIYDINFSNYYNQFYYPILLGVLPLTVMNTFSILSLRNIKQVSRRNLPVVRRDLDRQLTKMVLIQVAFVTIATIPFVSHYTYYVSTTFTDSVMAIKQAFITTILNMFWLISSSVKFKCILHIYHIEKTSLF
jgi:hypothetical protein